MPIFDTHCHYNLEPFYPDWKQHWQKAQAEGVTDSTVVSVDLPTSRTALQLAEEEPHFHPVIGCHPGYFQEVIEKALKEKPPDIVLTEALQLIEQEKKELLSLLNSRVVAIGETGLDYFRLPADDSAELIKKVQRAAFKAQLELAQETHLPIVIHARDQADAAYEDILNLIKETHFSQPFVLHCASGPSAYVQAAISLGAYIGLAGNLTYKNSEHLRELAAFTPPDRLLLETDAPFLPPVPYRGKPCEPWMISQTAKYLGEELNLDLAQIYQNSFQVFIKQ